MKHKLLIAALLCVATLTATAQQLPKDPAVREGHLSNGMTYFIRHNAQTPGQADFYLAQRVGSILEEPDQRGLAHFLEHMAFNGTENFADGNGGNGSIRNWCESKGIKFGADLNASTSVERTIYNIGNAPVTKAGVADTCLLILHDWSHSLLLRDNEIDQERGVIHEEWRTRRSQMAVQRIMEDAMPVMYRGTKYEDCLPIGHMEVVDSFAYDALRRYYKKWYRPDLQAVIVVGDVNVDEMEQKIKAVFSEIPAPAADAAERIYYPVTDNDSMITFIQPDDEQPTLNYQLFIKRGDNKREERATRQAFVDDYKSRLAMFILRQRLAQLPKADHPAMMSCGARDGNYYITDVKDALTINIGLMPDRPQAGIDSVFAVVEKTRRYGVTESELEHAKMQYNVNLEHRLETSNKTRNREYVSKIVNHFCNATHLMSIEQEADLEQSLMESVTLAEVNEKLKELIPAPETIGDGRNQVMMVYGPTKWDGKPYTMPAAADLKRWTLEAQKRTYADDNDYKPVDRTFMKKLPKKGKITARKEYGNGYTEYTLSNGMKVYARPSDLEPNRLTLKMFREGGMSLYPDQDIPSMRLLSNVVTQSGAADFDYLTLEKKRAGKALRVAPFFSSEEEGIDGVCTASDFKTWLQVAYLYITQPRRDDKMFNSIIERQTSMLRNRNASPKIIFNDTLRQELYANPERAVPLTIDNINQVSQDRIYQIYNERFSDMTGMSLIVTGDIRTDEFEDLICQYVASLPRAKKKAETAKPVYLDSRMGKHTNVFAYPQKTPSAQTEIVFTVPMAYTADNDLRADVLSQIMRAVYTETVREEKGGTYGVSVSSGGWTKPQEGYSLTISFRCDPDRYEQLVPIIDEQLSLMAKNGPTEKQLDKVKEYERKNYERAILTNDYWEYVCYNRISDGIDFDTDYLAKVNALTPADIQDFCKKVVAAGNRVQVTMK